MKLLLDLQGAQSQSRHRGIGRYTLALSRAFLERASRQHDVRLLLNSRFDAPTDALIATLGEYTKPDRRVMLEVPSGIRAQPGGNVWLRKAAARTMRYAIENLDADIVWHSSVFEGYNDDAVLPDDAPVGMASVATLYDLIPLHDAEAYLGHPRVRDWYMQSMGTLRRCDRLFAISEWVRQDAIRRLDLPPEQVINIGAAVDAQFSPPPVDPVASEELRRRHGIVRPYVLYNGGFDARKNVSALIHAFAALPEALRTNHQLVIVGRASQEELALLTGTIRKARLSPDCVVFTGFVPDGDLVRLYAECALFVFPSVLEGFGLPPLEAMACGAPTIVSDAASLPEVVGRSDARFNPQRIESICERMASVLGNGNFASELRRYGQERAAGFSWNDVADRALDTLQEMANRRLSMQRTVSQAPSTPLTCVLADGTEPPAWLGGLGAHVVSASAWDHSSDRVLYIADCVTAASLTVPMSSQPGVLLIQGAYAAVSRMPVANAVGAAYKANGYPGIMSLRQGHANAPHFQLIPPIQYALSILCTDDLLPELIRAQAPAMSLPDITVLSAHETSRACLQQLENAYATSAAEAAVLDDISGIDGRPSDDDLAAIANAIVTARPPSAARQWLVDVSSIAEKDIRTGVQRVARNILIHWLKSPPEGVRIEPVRFAKGRYRYARRYALELLDFTDASLPEDAAEAKKGDTFIGLDWAVDSIAAAEPQLRDWHRNGVNLQFIVHDLLPVTLPDMFHPYARNRFEEWLRRISSMADHLICVSKATAADLRHWLSTAAIPYQLGRQPLVNHFPLGADAVLGSAPQTLREPLAKAMNARPTLLMVGTIEPRKGYDQALDACELLWNDSANFNLVIVGRFGWLMDALRMRLENHAWRGQRLFWIDDADDSELEAIYRNSTALLAASWGEGFGLPLIEAARRNLPVIARDLPVFREVMDEHAHYFHAKSAADLASALHNWPSRHRSGQMVATTAWLSWEQSAAKLAQLLHAPKPSDRLPVR